MPLFFVGAHHQIGTVDDTVVQNDGHFGGFEIHGTGISGDASHLFDGGIVGELEFSSFGQIAEFGLVDFKVAPDHGIDQFAGHGVLIENRFTGVFGFESEEVRHLFDALGAGGVDLFQLTGFFFFIFPCGNGDFAVGTVAVVGGSENGIFTAVADGHEFVGDLAPHHAGVGLDGKHISQSDAAENTLIGFVGTLVILFQILLIGVETVSVFHGELTGTDQTGTGTCFITVLGLDLIKHHRQLFVTVDLAADQCGDALLMGHGKEHILVVAVFEAEQLCADALEAAGFFPLFGGQNHRHQDLLTVDPVHFLADNGFDAFNDLLSGGKQ